jgi:hypothetical protein
LERFQTIYKSPETFDLSSLTPFSYRKWQTVSAKLAFWVGILGCPLFRSKTILFRATPDLGSGAGRVIDFLFDSMDRAIDFESVRWVI